MPQPHDGEWLHRGESTLYTSDWVNLHLADVVLPDGTQIDHHVVRMPAPASGVVVQRDDEVLLLWRHRFITDTWGWEIPAGRTDAGETPEASARREMLEETGWEAGTIRPLISYHPTNGLSDQRFDLFLAEDPVHRGGPTDISEAERIEWRPWTEVLDLLRTGQITDGLSTTGLHHAALFARRHETNPSGA